MSIKIALAGNPNCGKTTLFNNLTGSNQYVGNWPGVTVDLCQDDPGRGAPRLVREDLSVLRLSGQICVYAGQTGY